MIELTKEETKKVVGGTDLTASMLTAIYKTIEVIFKVGESLGNFIRYLERYLPSRIRFSATEGL